LLYTATRISVARAITTYARTRSGVTRAFSVTRARFSIAGTRISVARAITTYARTRSGVTRAFSVARARFSIAGTRSGVTRAFSVARARFSIAGTLTYTRTVSRAIFRAWVVMRTISVAGNSRARTSISRTRIVSWARI